jgi:hypothetical protein
MDFTDLLVDFRDDQQAERADSDLQRYGACVLKPSGFAKHEGHYGVRYFSGALPALIKEVVVRAGGRVLGETNAFTPKF